MNHIFTTLGQVLLMVAARPDIRVREIALHLQVTERTVMHAIASLTQLGLVSVRRQGRKNVYDVNTAGRCDVGGFRIELADLVGLTAVDIPG